MGTQVDSCFKIAMGTQVDCSSKIAMGALVVVLLTVKYMIPDSMTGVIIIFFQKRLNALRPCKIK